MDRHIQSRIVKISLPATDSDKHWHFTGYVLCDGLVITCRHGFDNKTFDDNRRILIRCQSGSIDEEILFKGNSLADLKPSETECDGKPLVYESEDFDVALLACPNLKASYHRITPVYGDTGVWLSAGFPRFNKEREANGFELFAGTHLGPKNEGDFLTITVTEPSLNHDDDWKNASGSPIFIDGSLVGLLKKYRPEATGSFVVGYLHRLCNKDPIFLETLKRFIPDVLSYPQIKVKAFVEDEYNQDLVKTLCKQVAGEAHKEDFAKYLIELDEKDLIKLFQELDKANQKAAKPLLMYLLSASNEDTTISETDLAKQPYHNVSQAYPASCEFLMAAYDKREPSFIDDDLDAPNYCVSSVENGIESNSKFNEDFAHNLLNGKADINAVAERILRDFPRIPGFSYSKDDLISKTQGILEDQSESYYWPIQNVENKADDFLGVVKTYPQLLILNQRIDLKESGKEISQLMQIKKLLQD